MPKIVDHDARRAELAAALWRVVGRAGVAGATVRAVADEAGWSMGALRHYFASQGELLRFAMDTLLQDVPPRLAAHLAADLEPRERARRLLLELVPVDEERRIEAIVWLALLERSRTDPSLAEPREIAWLGERHICRLVVAELLDLPAPASPQDRFEDESSGERGAQAAGSSTERGARATGPAGIAPSPEEEAEALHTFVDGITLQATTWPGEWTPAAMRASAERQLDSVLQRAGR
ncbi:MAG: TetR/AcrR family transcriptional regulator [Solirubrobacteraceae bacterium]|nr:TetR/AcrR family transcriptional regulator [Solirubrobacteraceae bacterium]